MTSPASPPVLSLVVPAHNEASAIPVFLARVLPILRNLALPTEIIFVDDGSTDTTANVVDALRGLHPEIRLIVLTRNFGKEAALTAGLTFASGLAVIPIDCDLQDPPELIPAMLEQWRAGFQVVHGRRRDRTSDTPLKRMTAAVFYRLMRRIAEVDLPADCGDFRLMDRRVVAAVLDHPERNRFMKGIMAACGFRQAFVDYERPPRNHGASKFRLWRLWNFALDGITGFSTLPLRIWTYVGACVALAAFSYAAWTIFKTIWWGVVTPGYATLLTVFLGMGGLQLIGIGVLGEYLGRIFLETKRRPIFLVDHMDGFDANSPNR